MSESKARRKRKPHDPPISLAPLDFETALEALLATGPHPKEEPPVPKEMENHSNTKDP